jgi:hypothetical protein
MKMRRDKEGERREGEKEVKVSLSASSNRKKLNKIRNIQIYLKILNKIIHNN